MAYEPRPCAHPDGRRVGVLGGRGGGVLVRFGARDYDPAVGRWSQKDGAGFHGGRNLYVYAANDPINFVDITGFDPTLAQSLGLSREAWQAANAQMGPSDLEMGMKLGVLTGGALDAAGAFAVIGTALDSLYAAASAAVLANRAQAGAQNLTATASALEHMLERHAFGTCAVRAGKFASDADIPQLIRATVANALASGTFSWGNASNPTAVVFESTFPAAVGVTSNGAPAYGIRVVLDFFGSLVTAFPIR